MSRSRVIAKGTITVTLPRNVPLPKEFERYLALKVASDLMAIEAAKLYTKMLEPEPERK